VDLGVRRKLRRRERAHRAQHDGGLQPAGLGSGAEAFDLKRYEASGSFLVLRGELSRTQELPWALQGALKVQGQMASDPLVGSEQFAIGGLESVRGFLEAVASGDYGAAGQLELRSPSLARWFGKRVLTEWRFHAFADAGWNRVYAPLPEEQAERFLWSVGAGTRARLFGRLSGALEVAVPFERGARSVAFLFKVAGEI
jgi:hemolysin activation/secretion protein